MEENNQRYCRRCDKFYPLAGFYVNKKDKYQYHACKVCMKASAQRCKEKKARGNIPSKHELTKIIEEYAPIHYEIRNKSENARKETRKAITKGLVRKRPSHCENCGIGQSLQCHHRNYSDPLDIEWLCFCCHLKAHYGSFRD